MCGTDAAAGHQAQSEQRHFSEMIVLFHILKRGCTLHLCLKSTKESLQPFVI